MLESDKDLIDEQAAEIERLRVALEVAQTYLPHVRPEAPVEGLMAAQRLIAEALER